MQNERRLYIIIIRNPCLHLHNHQWRLEGENPYSTILDSISISPQECYTLDILHGAGSLNGVIGDVMELPALEIISIVPEA